MGIPDHLTSLLRNLYAGQEATFRAGHGTTDWFQIGKGVCQGCILSPCLFNLYVEYIMRNAGLEEAQAGIKIGIKNQSKWLSVRIMTFSKLQATTMLNRRRPYWEKSPWAFLFLSMGRMVQRVGKGGNKDKLYVCIKEIYAHCSYVSFNRISGCEDFTCVLKAAGN